MRSCLALAALLALACACAGAPVRTRGGPPPPQGSPEGAVLERSLGPYGEWLFLAPYGRVWQPAGIAPGWRPYLHGEWMWTDEGWFWASDEPWGWATYHYGRWLLDGTFGWVWAPGEAWAPGWVAWRVADAYVGWAPLLPGAEASGLDASAVDPAYWVFVPWASLVGTRAGAAAIPEATVRGLLGRTRPAPAPGRAAPGAPPRGGPSRAEVERQSRRPVPLTRLVPVATPAEARARPERGSVPTFRPAPAPPPPPARGP